MQSIRGLNPPLFVLIKPDVEDESELREVHSVVAKEMTARHDRWYRRVYHVVEARWLNPFSINDELELEEDHTYRTAPRSRRTVPSLIPLS
jgi:hypothetical protein